MNNKAQVTAALLLLFAFANLVYTTEFVTIVDDIPVYWPPTALAGCLGVPSYSAPNSYTIINLGFWLTNGQYDALAVWSNPLYYCTSNNPWGSTNQEIQRAWLNDYHNNGKLVLASAFGSSQWPTTAGADPITTANALADFLIANQLDGVDICYEDNTAMTSGTGVDWLIAFTNQLKSQLPANLIITHSPQAPYFMASYPDGGYLTVNQQVGASIDWYNIQFFNQASSAYSSFETLFETSDGWANNTAVLQLESAGVPLQKIIVAKPVAQSEASNTGYIPLDTFSSIITTALNSTSWKAGVMGWEYALDASGDWINTLAADFL